jgi:hypothetical protein
MCNMFIGLLQKILSSVLESLFPGTILENPVKSEHIVPLMVSI